MRSGSAPGKRSGASGARRARILARSASPGCATFRAFRSPPGQGRRGAPIRFPTRRAARGEAANDRRAHLDPVRAREAVAHDVPAVLRVGRLVRHPWRPISARACASTGPRSARAYSTMPWGAIVAPFVIGMIADRFFAAERVLGVLHLVGAVAALWRPPPSTDARARSSGCCSATPSATTRPSPS